MRAPFTCVKCGKEMYSVTELVENWGAVYCKSCDQRHTQGSMSSRSSAEVGLPFWLKAVPISGVLLIVVVALIDFSIRSDQRRTVSSACGLTQRVRTPSSDHPIGKIWMVFRDDEGRNRAFFAQDFLGVARSLNETDTVVCIAEDAHVSVGDCSYTRNEFSNFVEGTIKRHRVDWEFKIIDWHQRTVLREGTLTGEEPQPCPKVLMGVTSPANFHWDGNAPSEQLVAILRQSGSF